MIFTLPPLGLFLGIYFWTGDLVIGAIIGFSVHFVILAFSGRISKIYNQNYELNYKELIQELIYHDGR